MALAGREGCRQWEDLKLANVTTTPSIILASNSGSISGHFLTVTVMIVYQINITRNKNKHSINTHVPEFAETSCFYVTAAPSLLSSSCKNPHSFDCLQNTHIAVACVPKSTVLCVGAYLPGKVLSVIPSSIVHQLSK